MAIHHQHNVGGFQVPVNDPHIMSIFNRFGDHRSDSEPSIKRYRVLFDALLECLALDVFYYQVILILVAADLLDVTDIGMFECCSRRRCAGDRANKDERLPSREPSFLRMTPDESIYWIVNVVVVVTPSQ
jgi:hypothetical protein